MEHTETLIVEQLKTGNEDAYQYIYDRHYALLCHVANGYVKDQFLAETFYNLEVTVEAGNHQQLL